MFTAAKFTAAKTWERPKCPSTDGCVKMCLPIYNARLRSHRKNEIMLFAATRMGLEMIILSQSERQIPYDITYRWNRKYDTNERMYETEQNCGCQAVQAGNGLEVWDSQMRTIIYRMDKKLDPTVYHRELRSVSYDRS